MTRRYAWASALALFLTGGVVGDSHSRYVGSRTGWMLYDNEDYMPVGVVGFYNQQKPQAPWVGKVGDYLANQTGLPVTSLPNGFELWAVSKDGNAYFRIGNPEYYPGNVVYTPVPDNRAIDGFYGVDNDD